MKSRKLTFPLMTLGLCLSIIPMMAAAQPGPPAAPVAVEEALRDTFSASLWVSGTVISRNDSRIGAESTGQAAQRPVPKQPRTRSA